MMQIKQLIFMLMLCIIPTIASDAHNKVVVIPLDDSETRTSSPVVERTLMYGTIGMAGSAESSPTGRLLVHDSLQGVTLYIKKPSDWNGTSDITLEMMARGLGLGSETFLVQFIDYEDGDRITSEGLGQIVFNTTSSNRLFQTVGQQRILTATIPAQHAQEEWWRIGIRRNNLAGTNQSTIVFESVAISYLPIQY